jgi:tryptophan synthase alpha chain
VSLKGVTGASHIDIAEVAAAISRIKAYCALPIAVGFGIRDPAAAKKICQVADAVVIGSRIVQEIEASSRQTVVDSVCRLVNEFRMAMNEPQGNER